MKISDLWHAAFVRLGANDETARSMIVRMSALAPSSEAFEQWNSRLPDAAGWPLIKAIEGPRGDILARSILTAFRDTVMQRFSITEDEIARQLAINALN